jgi:hypothetical protein
MADQYYGLLSPYVIQDSNEQKGNYYVFDELIMESFPQINKEKDYERTNRNGYNVIHQTDAGLFENIGL